MYINEATKTRHSVRSYTDRQIDETSAARLEAVIAECAADSGLDIQLVRNEPGASIHAGSR